MGSCNKDEGCLAFREELKQALRDWKVLDDWTAIAKVIMEA